MGTKISFLFGVIVGCNLKEEEEKEKMREKKKDLYSFLQRIKN